MEKQFFGYTGPTPPTGYVKYIAAGRNAEGAIVVVVRNERCEHTEIALPIAAAFEFGTALIAATAQPSGA